MKKSVLSIFLLIVTIGFVSAQGIADILTAFDESTVILSSIFIVEFSLLFFALQKAFKGNNAIAAIVSGVIAFFTVYFVNKTGFDFSGFFINLGISSDLIMTIVPIIIVLGIIFAIVKLKMGSFFVFGGLLILASFFVVEQLVLIVIGIILLVIGLFFMTKKKHSLSTPKINSANNTTNVTNIKNVENIKNEERRVEQEQKKDQQAVQQERKVEEKRQQQAQQDVKQLAYKTDMSLRNLINEYNNLQRNDPGNREGLVYLRDRILKERDELKRLRGGN
ncbi:Uncharacterised protein [uncultured archaeon]|nr:Uncharacterised protein [uncultured archaeon]